MPTKRKPRTPAGLTPAAARVFAATVKAFEMPDAHSLAVLESACRSLSRAEQLDALVDAEGMTTRGSRGQTVLHPAIAEARQCRLAAGRLLGSLGLEAPSA